MATSTTGSTVYGLNAGMADHLGGGVSVIQIIGNPSGIVCTVPLTTGNPSGAVIAHDATNDTYYLYNNATKWIKIGSVSF
jgi:hypothetical protein